ncbi:MAG TPA: bifunctional demethylmenaquinone methyltransferase/2-methoxy-6-polyprenyl-1,4-benzoquinol methylase UbiE [Candidatus Acidoferrales bacterium]|nr:bifunctional demethylmenaquinone methyltransferase/2-methoxy-6-polyprenyl-1,4-benzoquinol methylase UbiE [Candidatus Acidoferrales bacterium]
MDTEAHNAAPGTRPEGSRDEREAGQQVREMFTRIAPRYDFLNHLLSASLDRVWRRRTAKRFADILSRPDAQVLDLCCGTGDLILALTRQAEQSGPRAGVSSKRFIGADFAFPMLAIAKKKQRTAHLDVVFLAVDALVLPFRDASFDLITTAFGFRNLTNYENGLREIARVLRPGGRLGILEFCEPENGFLGKLYRLYFTRVLPRIGGAISRNREAYTYLPNSVKKFPRPETLANWMEKLEFRDTEFERWTCGIVALHSAVRK